MSSLLGGPGLEPSPAAKAAAAMRSCDEVKMEAEEEEKPADSLLLKTLCTCEAESIKVHVFDIFTYVFYLSTRPWVHLSTYLFIYISISIYPYIFLLIILYVSSYLFSDRWLERVWSAILCLWLAGAGYIYLSIYLSIYRIYLSIYPSIYIQIAGKEGLTCQAVEVVGGHRVGCKNKISRSELVKTSPHTDPVGLVCET